MAVGTSLKPQVLRLPFPFAQLRVKIAQDDNYLFG